MWRKRSRPFAISRPRTSFRFGVVLLNDATRTPGARDTAEQDVVVDTRQVARTMTELFSPLDFNYSAVKEYSEAAVAGKPMPCPFSL
ncbi:MAG: hypothetical protein ACREJN_01470 [Nitrospiraceae bacterium]